MFIGHVAVGLASKRLAPKTSLGLLVAAPLALDLLWPVFVLVGSEEVRIDPGNTAVTPLDFASYPWSHSLLLVILWSVLAAAAYWLWTRYRAGVLVIGAGVLSHWVLDAISHRPDLPLYPGSDIKIGLGLWYSVPATVVVEGAMFAAAVWLYASRTKPLSRAGSYSFWAFVGVLVAIYAANIFGPPPADSQTVALTALALWLLPIWAWRFDARRVYATTA
jgi:FtsH-binding integral membrane protein